MNGVTTRSPRQRAVDRERLPLTAVALAALLRALQGFRPARYLLAAWGLLMLCVLVFLVQRATSLPSLSMESA